MPTTMPDLIERFRRRIMDTDPLRNILAGKLEFGPDELGGFITEAWYDVNETEPITTIPLEVFPKTTLLLDGALIFLLRGRGLLHLRNQISYSDAGFSVNLDDKSGNYALWMEKEVQMYFLSRKNFKRSMVPRFRGVGSPMRWYRGW